MFQSGPAVTTRRDLRIAGGSGESVTRASSPQDFIRGQRPERPLVEVRPHLVTRYSTIEFPVVESETNKLTSCVSIEFLLTVPDRPAIHFFGRFAELSIGFQRRHRQCEWRPSRQTLNLVVQSHRWSYREPLEKLLPRCDGHTVEGVTIMVRKIEAKLVLQLGNQGSLVD